MQNLDLLLDGLQGKKKRKKRRKKEKRKKKDRGIHLKLNWLAFPSGLDSPTKQQQCHCPMLNTIYKDQSTQPRGRDQDNVCIPSEPKHSTGRLQPPRKTHHSAQWLPLTSGFLPVRMSPPLLPALIAARVSQQLSPSSVSASL